MQTVQLKVNIFNFLYCDLLSLQKFLLYSRQNQRISYYCLLLLLGDTKPFLFKNLLASNCVFNFLLVIFSIFSYLCLFIVYICFEEILIIRHFPSKLIMLYFVTITLRWMILMIKKVALEKKCAYYHLTKVEVVLFLFTLVATKLVLNAVLKLDRKIKY